MGQLRRQGIPYPTCGRAPSHSRLRAKAEEIAEAKGLPGQAAERCNKRLRLILRRILHVASGMGSSPQLVQSTNINSFCHQKPTWASCSTVSVGEWGGPEKSRTESQVVVRPEASLSRADLGGPVMLITVEAVAQVDHEVNRIARFDGDRGRH